MHNWGYICIGDSIYGLTVAHSVREGKFVDKFVERRFDRPCGSIEFYQWSGDEDIELEDPSGDAYMTTKPAIAMDWMLLRLNSHYTAHNTFRSLDGTVQQNVSGFVATAELLDDEVWIFSTRPQIGILDSTPSTIILGQISYDVFSIALVSPLDAGDSGSWVVRDHKLCGYIFARLDGVALAYMLPIEPVFGEISRLFSKDAEVKVDVPDATTIESWLGRGQPLEITVDNVSTVETKLPNTPHGRIRSSSMSVTSSQAFDSELSTTHVDLISRPSPWKTIEPGLDAREDGPSQIREEPPVREELPIYEAFPPSRPSETSPRSQTDSPFVPRIFVNGINPFGSRRSRLRGLNTPALRNRTPPSQFIESQRPEPVLGGDLVLGIGEGRSIPLLDMSNFSQSPRPILPPSSMSDSTRHQEALPLVTGASDLDLELGQEALRPPRSQTRLKWLNKVKEQQSLRVRKTIAFLVEVLLVVVYFAIIGALTGTITIFPSLHITVVGKALGIVAMVVALIAWILLVGWFLVRKVLVRKVEAHEEAEPTSREDSRRY
ncbi:hypothetical protein N431DRAFT_87211 [Stipitochalara longipes BDJ]|nr:hypothetical protein N431DRAFT_87211 [Stipitochalara longipes BDJ]